MRLVYIHTPISARSTLAAEAAECAYRQGRFWEFKEILYDRQPEWGMATDWQDRIVSYGQEAGLDMQALIECLRSGEVRPALQADIDLSNAQKIKYTPTIIMSDGSRFVGSDLEPLDKALEGALKLRGER